MIAVLVCDRNERELALIARNCREQIARGSGEQFQLESVAGDAGLASAAENEKLAAAGGGNVQITMSLNEKDDDKGDAE